MSKKRSKARRTAQPAPQPVPAREQVAPVAMAHEAAEATEIVEDGTVVVAAIASVEAGGSVSGEATEGSDDRFDVAASRSTGGDANAAPHLEATAQPGPVEAPADTTAVAADADAVRFAPFDDPSAIRGVLIQVAGGRLLLPNATIAEVLSYAEPDPVGGDAPDWLLGRMRWRGWQLPLVAFSQLAGVGTERAGLGTKVVVLKALGGQGKTPYFAILTQGFPRLVTVSQSALEAQGGEGTLPRGIQARVRLNQDDALLPDLESIEGLIVDALAQAA